MAVALVNVDGNPITSADLEMLGIRQARLIGKLSFSGTYTAQANGGDVVDFTTLKELLVGTIISARVWTVNNSTNWWRLIANASAALWNLLSTDKAGTETANGAAYPADTVHFELIMKRYL